MINLNTTTVATGGCVQGRRIRCAHCGKPYHYLVLEMISGSTEQMALGVGALYEDDMARASVLVQIDALRGQPEVGYAPCPHCRRYQPWMSRQQSIGRLLGIIGWSVAIAAFTGVLFSFPVFLVVAGLLTVNLVFQIGRVVSRWVWPDVRDGLLRSYKDHDFDRLMDEHAGDPKRILIAMIKRSGQKSVPGADFLGFLDFTDSPVYPDSLSHAALHPKIPIPKMKSTKKKSATKPAPGTRKKFKPRPSDG